MYCYDLSERTAYVDQQRLYGNFTSLALAVEGQEYSDVQASLAVPAAFLAGKDESRLLLACGLESTHLRLDGQHSYGLQSRQLSRPY